MNEDAHGITPANVTAMTLEKTGFGWRATIERGNGAFVQTLNLSDWERAQLGMLLDSKMGHVEFVDLSRPTPAQPEHGG